MLARNGTFGLELVADLPAWDEYSNRVTFRSKRGPHGKPIQLIESVKQDRRKHITRFEQEFVEGRGKSATRKKFSLAFRTLIVPQMVQRLEKAGLEVSALLGDYQGGPVGPSRRGLDYSRPGRRPRAVEWTVMFRAILAAAILAGVPALAQAQSASAPLDRDRHRRLDLSCELAAPGRALALLDAAGRRHVRPRPRCAACADAGRAAPQRSSRRRPRHQFLDRPPVALRRASVRTGFSPARCRCMAPRPTSCPPKMRPNAGTITGVPFGGCEST